MKFNTLKLSFRKWRRRGAHARLMGQQGPKTRFSAPATLDGASRFEYEGDHYRDRELVSAVRTARDALLKAAELLDRADQRESLQTASSTATFPRPLGCV